MSVGIVGSFSLLVICFEGPGTLMNISRHNVHKVIDPFKTITNNNNKKIHKKNGDIIYIIQINIALKEILRKSKISH